MKSVHALYNCEMQRPVWWADPQSIYCTAFSSTKLQTDCAGTHHFIMYMIDVQFFNCLMTLSDRGAKQTQCLERTSTVRGSPDIPRRSEDTAAVAGCTAAQCPTETIAWA